MWYWTLATLLMLVNACCVFANVLMLPGNWMMLGTLCIFILSKSSDDGPGWTTVLIVGVVAILGELIELGAGSATASRQGASRRAMFLSLCLSVVGSITGAILVAFPPLIGSAIGAISGAGIGAFAGAWLGETWKGKDTVSRAQVGSAALVGRLLGMAGKMAIGVAIFVIQLISLWM